ncbi:unnamed protein product, partial [Ectocarpus sp. 12 AP-2014]
HTDWVTGLAVAEGRIMASASYDGTLKLTPPLPPPPPPPRPNALATVAGHGDYVKCLTYAEQRGVLVTGGLDKRILLWDLQRMSAPLMVLRGGDPLRVALRTGQVAAGPNEVLELCRQNKGSVHCVASAADASLVASGGTDRMIRLLDPRAGGGQAAKVCKLDGHGDNVRCVKIDEGGTRVVSSLS